MLKGFPIIYHRGNRDDNYRQLELLYRAMLHRAPDAAGKEAWVAAMAGGATMKDVIKGIAASDEFRKICADYGINPGTAAPAASGQPAPSGEPASSVYDQEKLRTFLRHCYLIGLGRNPDEKGLQDWQDLLNSGKLQPKDVLRGFVESKEMKDKNLDDRAFVELLYRLYLDRDGEQEGIANWMMKLTEGWTRVRVADAFATSPEFKRVVDSLKK